MQYVLFANGLFGDTCTAYAKFAEKLASHRASRTRMYERGDIESQYNRAFTTYKRQLNKAVVQARVNIITADINEWSR